MDAIDALTSRSSIPKLKLPAPSKDDLDILFRAAFRAPDHGMLKPWRFVVAEGERLNVLGEYWAEALQESEPSSSEEALAKIRLKPLRAPMVIVAYTDIQESDKVPAIEQIVATGAAVQNMLIAAHALGYAGYWRTGSLAYNASLKKKMGLKNQDEIVGFIYLGTADCQPKQLKPVDFNDYILHF